MPSRAVLRKKARRENKRSKEEQTPVVLEQVAKRVVLEHVAARKNPTIVDVAVEKATEEIVAKVNERRIKNRLPLPTVVPRMSGEAKPHDTKLADATSYHPATVVEATPQGGERQRAEDGPHPAAPHFGNVASASTTEKSIDDASRVAMTSNSKRQREGENYSHLTRKERRRAETQRKLEKQISRLDADARRGSAPVLDDKPVEGGIAEGDAPPSAATPEPPKLRHDPKFFNGTFWKERKEKKKRTLFVGNLPLTSTPKTITALVDAVLASSIADDVEGVAMVEGVDILPKKFGARVVHAYVTLRSAEMIPEAIKLLDNLPIDNNNLRVNPADDKDQRDKAISKRTGSKHLPQWAPGRGFGRGRGTGFGRGRGAARGRGSFAPRGRASFIPSFAMSN